MEITRAMPGVPRAADMVDDAALRVNRRESTTRRAARAALALASPGASLTAQRDKDGSCASLHALLAVRERATRDPRVRDQVRLYCRADAQLCSMRDARAALEACVEESSRSRVSRSWRRSPRAVTRHRPGSRGSGRTRLAVRGAPRRRPRTLALRRTPRRTRARRVRRASSRRSVAHDRERTGRVRPPGPRPRHPARPGARKRERQRVRPP
jgi:hypothetical protein